MSNKNLPQKVDCILHIKLVAPRNDYFYQLLIIACDIQIKLLSPSRKLCLLLWPEKYWDVRDICPFSLRTFSVDAFTLSINPYLVLIRYFWDCGETFYAGLWKRVCMLSFQLTGTGQIFHYHYYCILKEYFYFNSLAHYYY